ncbi:hypothetical protein V9R52_000871 [Vibrio mimicus]
MTTYHNDQPINSSRQDLLNRASFCKALSGLVTLDKDSPCLTVSIEGVWGTGKTSIINLTLKALEGNSKLPIVVKYNPWVNGKSNTLVEDFLVQFTSQLGLVDYQKEGMKIATELLSYSKLFSAAKLIPGVEPFGSLVENIFNKVGDATQSLSDLKKLDVQGQKKKVIDNLKKINKPIVVIIDDIDRLTPSECFQVLRLVKAIADFPRTAFVLAFDPTYLHSVLAANNIGNANQYIDKIVQLRLPVPLITKEDLGHIVDTTLEELEPNFSFNHYQDDHDRFIDIYNRHIKQLLTTPRDVKRAINHFKFVYTLVKQDVSTTDLFVLSVIATKCNKIYEDIKNHPWRYASHFNGTNFWVTQDKDKEQVANESKEQRNIIYKSLEMTDNNPIEELLKEVFPSIPREHHFDFYNVDDADAAGRVDSIKRLTTALHVGMPKGMCSKDDVIRFITDADKNMDALSNAIQINAISRFIELYGFEVESQSHSPEHYIKSLKRLAEELMANNSFNQQDSLYGDFYVQASVYTMLVRLLRKTIRIADNKQQILKQTIEEIALLPLIAPTISLMKAQHNESTFESPWMSENDTNAILDSYAIASKQTLLNNQLASNVLEYHMLLPLWTHRVDIVNEILSEIKHDDVLRIGYLNINEIGADSSVGTYLSVNIDKTNLDSNALKIKAEKLLESTDNLLDKAVLLSICDEKKHYIKNGNTVED